MRKRRKVTSLGVETLHKASLKKMKCHCGREVFVDADTVSVRCYICTSTNVPAPSVVKRVAVEKKATGFPRGWHLYKLYVAADGTAYEYGKENPKLKGKHPPTQPKVTEKISKWERRRRKEEKAIRKMKRLAKKHKAKQKEKKS